ANAPFQTPDHTNALATPSADATPASNTGMSVSKTFTPSGGGRATSFTTSSTLFPFTPTYGGFAGSCGSNDPGAGTMLGNVNVPPGGSGALQAPGYIQLASAQATVWSGTSASSPGTRLSGAKVTAKDTSSTCNVTRTLTPTGGTNANGQVPQAPPTGGDIGLPYGTYDICASNSAGTDKRIVPGVALTSAGATGTPINVYTGGAPGGTCP